MNVKASGKYTSFPKVTQPAEHSTQEKMPLTNSLCAVDLGQLPLFDSHLNQSSFN